MNKSIDNIQDTDPKEDDKNETEHQTFDLTILPVRHETKKIRTKRPIDPRLPLVDEGVNMIVCSPPRTGKSNLIANWLYNSQICKGYWDLVYLIGASVKVDKTLRQLTKIYESTTFDYFNDELINRIVKYQLSFEPEERPNAIIIIDDALALPNFSKQISALSRLTSNYRHILGGAEGGGALMYASQKITSFPTSLRACANVIILGKNSNIAQRKIASDEWGDTFGGQDQFLKMFDYCTADKYNFMCLYVDGNSLYSHPCAYKNFDELVFPTQMFPPVSNEFDSKQEPLQPLENNDNNQEIKENINTDEKKI